MVIKNKKAWIRIVEAFTMILLIAGVLLVILNRPTILNDQSSQVYDIEYSILRGIQLNLTLRSTILGLSLPSNPANFPNNLNYSINQSIPASLTCTAMICQTYDSCLLSSGSYPNSQNIYTKSAFISANPTIYSPRQLKIFCW